MSEVVGMVLSNLRKDRLVDFMAKLEERVGDLEDNAVQEAIRSDGGVRLLEEALPHAARAQSDERIGHLASVVANGLSENKRTQTDRQRILHLLSQLDDVEVILLRGRLMTWMGTTETRSSNARTPECCTQDLRTSAQLGRKSGSTPSMSRDSATSRR